MRVAVTLTGLIEDRHVIANYIKRMFDQVGSKHNIEFDFYFHYWSNNRPYLYLIDTKMIAPINFPIEQTENINHFIDAIKPAQVITNNYYDLKQEFINYGIELSPGFMDILETYIDKEINENTFFELDKEYAGTHFYAWWSLHKNWFSFIHLTAQYYAVEQCLKAIGQSGIKYDAVLKWRSDLLFRNSDFYTNVLLSALKYIKPRMISVSNIWRDNKIRRVPINNLSNTHDGINDLCVHDIWWVTDLPTSNFLSNNLFKEYCWVKKNQTQLELANDGQHVWLYYALHRLGFVFDLPGELDTVNVRNTSLLPPLNGIFDIPDYIDSLRADSNRQSKLTKLVISNIDNYKYSYHVAKNFKFI